MQACTTVGFLKLGAQPRIVCLHWTSNTQLIIGTSLGEVLQASLIPAGQLDDNLALVSPIIPQCKCPIVTFCHNPIRNLIAISFIGKIQIWSLRLDSTRRRRWILYDTIRCLDKGNDWCATAITFFGENNRSLCAVTHFGFIIWTYTDKSSFRCYNHDFKAEVSHCVVLLDNLSMAVSTSDRSILIWPLEAAGPVISEQRTFNIPTGRSWIEYAESAPLAYFDAEAVITADPIRNIYVLSLEGEPKHVFPVGENYFIRSILVSDQMFNVVAMGPVCTTMLIGFTVDAAVHRHVAKAWNAKASRPLPHAITQHVTVATLTEVAGAMDKEHPGLKTGHSYKPLAFIWRLFMTLTHYFCLRNLLASVAILYYHNMLSLDFMCIYNIVYITAQIAIYELALRTACHLLFSALRLGYRVFYFVARTCVVAICTLILSCFSN